MHLICLGCLFCLYLQDFNLKNGNQVTLMISPVSVYGFQAWYRRGMVNASFRNYSSSIHDLEVALSMEVTSSGKSNIEQELKLILQKHQNVNEIGTSSSNCINADMPHTGR